MLISQFLTLTLYFFTMVKKKTEKKAHDVRLCQHLELGLGASRTLWGIFLLFCSLGSFVTAALENKGSPYESFHQPASKAAALSCASYRDGFCLMCGDKFDFSWHASCNMMNAWSVIDSGCSLTISGNKTALLISSLLYPVLLFFTQNSLTAESDTEEATISDHSSTHAYPSVHSFSFFDWCFF